MLSLPAEFLERLQDIIPEKNLDQVLSSFSFARDIGLRVNNLKSSNENALSVLENLDPELKKVSWYKDAFCINQDLRQGLHETNLMNQGAIYIQGLSSMLPAWSLNPQPGDRVLDFCAAPGSKTTQIASLMQNKGTIVALESVKNRFYKLKNMLRTMHVEIAEARLLDARKYKSQIPFNKILVDAPCSSEGRFKRGNKKSLAYWSLRKIKEMQRKQKQLLKAAQRHLQDDGEMLYSTCTFAPEENEAVIDWFLKKHDGEYDIVPICLPSDILLMQGLTEWKGKSFDPALAKTVRVLPSKDYEAFYMAKITKRKH